VTVTISTHTFRVPASGVTLAGERWDPQERPAGTVVLLHGGGQTRHSWDATARRLAEHGWVAVALDARGHGDSDWDPGGDYSLDAFVRDLVAFVSTLEEAPVLVGASLGGITSLTAAGEHPALARALVLVDVVVQLEPAGVERIRAFMRSRPDGFGSLEEVADAVAAYNPLRPRPRNLDGLRKNVRLGDDGRWRWHWDPAFMDIGDEPQRQIDPVRLRAAAERLTVPTLIVRGARSDVVSDDGMADMLRRIPHAQAVDVAAAGHMVAGDDNDVFAAALESFLTGLDSDPQSRAGS
jgi:pimeloyl-ACP methyl ester carboxylesterase